jgi:hypothetical protein
VAEGRCDGRGIGVAEGRGEGRGIGVAEGRGEGRGAGATGRGEGRGAGATGRGEGRGDCDGDGRGDGRGCDPRWAVSGIAKPNRNKTVRAVQRRVFMGTSAQDAGCARQQQGYRTRAAAGGAVVGAGSAVGQRAVLWRRRLSPHEDTRQADFGRPRGTMRR